MYFIHTHQDQIIYKILLILVKEWIFCTFTKKICIYDTLLNVKLILYPHCSTKTNDKKYYLILSLFGSVISEETIHKNVGREIKIYLTKTLKCMIFSIISGIT